MDSVPAWVSWVGFGSGLLALGIGVVTLPTAFQMFFGRPDIAIRFADDNNEGMHRLKCYISNRGIDSAFLRWIGVVRSPVEINAVLSLSEYGTKKIIISLTRIWLTTDKGAGLHVDLPFSIVPARCNLIGYSNESGAFVIPQDERHEAISLERGVYVARIDVITAHQVTLTEKRYIIVGQGTPYWSEHASP